MIPIGNEIYQDENGSVFLVPKCLNKDNILEISDIWSNIQNTKFKNVAINLKGEWESKKLENIANRSDNLKELIEKISSYGSSGYLRSIFYYKSHSLHTTSIF